MKHSLDFDGIETSFSIPLLRDRPHLGIGRLDYSWMTDYLLLIRKSTVDTRSPLLSAINSEKPVDTWNPCCFLMPWP